MEADLGKSGLRFWVALVTVTTMLAGAWTYYNATRSYTNCADGHCPDPGTREYLAGVQTMNESAPQTAFIVMLAVVALGLMIRVLWALARRLRKM
jgi:hypothetical protein